MSVPFKYNISEILWSPVRALSAKKITLMTGYLIDALIFYDIFTYIALIVEGEKFSNIWKAYSFFPFAQCTFDNLAAQIIFAVGVSGAVLLIMMGMFAIAAIEIERIRGNPFMSFMQAIKFSFKRINQILLSEISIILFMVLIIGLFALFGSIGRIPWIGDWIMAIFFVIPGFIVAIISVFIMAVLCCSLLLLPATAAADRNGETFNSILETFSTIIREPARWVGYTAYSLVAGKISIFIYAFFCYLAINFSTWAISLGGGAKVERLLRSGLSHLPVNSEFVREIFSFYSGSSLVFSFKDWMRGGNDDWAGYLMAFMLFLIFTSIIGYFFSILATAQANGFAVIRYAKDNHKISEEDSLFHSEEHINPPIEE